MSIHSTIVYRHSIDKNAPRMLLSTTMPDTIIMVFIKQTTRVPRK
jgi:hypothetical protein